MEREEIYYFKYTGRIAESEEERPSEAAIEKGLREFLREQKETK